MGSQDLKHWSTASYMPQERIDIWSEMLTSSHLPWTISNIPSENFEANLSIRSFNDYKLINCSCDTLKGSRNSLEICNTDESYFCILLLREGKEKITVRDSDLFLKSGDIILWDSTQKMSFHVPEHIEKTSLMFPSTALTSIFPKAHDFAGSVIPAESGMASMLARHLSSLKQEMWRLDASCLTSLMKPTMEMLTAVLTGTQVYSPSSMRSLTLQRVKKYIINNLSNPTLSPLTIADSNGISIRYLHVLFEGEKTTVSNWVKKCRLHRCKDDLCSVQNYGRTITELAFKWGFNDISHFSKVFKNEFGCSPRDYTKLLNAQSET